MTKLAILTLVSVLSLHQFHISKIDVNADMKTLSYQITVNLFIDDLELALKNSSTATNLRIGTSKEHSDADDHIAEYLSNHLTVMHDGKALYFTFVGKENSDNLQAINCYLECDIPGGKLGKITVKSNILLHEFSDQKNIISFQKSNKLIDQHILDNNKQICNWEGSK